FSVIGLAVAMLGQRLFDELGLVLVDLAAQRHKAARSEFHRRFRRARRGVVKNLARTPAVATGFARPSIIPRSTFGALVSEERNGFLPGRDIAVDSRRLLAVFGFVFGTEFRIAGQILIFVHFLVEVVIGFRGIGSRRRAWSLVGASLLARPAVTRTTV